MQEGSALWGGGVFAGGRALQHGVSHALVFQVGPMTAGVVLRSGSLNARLGIHRPRFSVFDQARHQLAQVMAVQVEVLCSVARPWGLWVHFKAWFAKRRFALVFEVPQVAVQHHHIHSAHSPGPVPPHAPGQLDE